MRTDRPHWEERHANAAPDRPAPSAFLVRHVELIQGRALDVACGRGRNALFLARRGIAVDAIDIALAALEQLRQVALAEHLRVQLVQADLDEFPLPVERYDAVINIRFLNRRLFPALARALKPGGVLLFETFLIDQMRTGHPKNPDFLLQHGELRAAFDELEILVYEEGLLDGEAHLARLLARRPPCA